MAPSIGDPIEETKLKMSSGPSGFDVTRPTQRELLYNANLALYVDHKNGVIIHKNRWGPHGKVSTKELVNILTRILVEHVFDGRMKVFQEGMRWRLKGAINKIVKDGA